MVIHRYGGDTGLYTGILIKMYLYSASIQYPVQYRLFEYEVKFKP